MILQCIAAMLGVWGFAVLFHAPRKYYLSCAANGAIGWICYLLLTQMGASIAVSTVLSSIVLTVVSRALAVLQKAPATIFLVTGIFPLVPGAGIYYAAYYFMQQNWELGGTMTIEVLAFAGSIALGILIGSILPQKYFSKLEILRLR